MATQFINIDLGYPVENGMDIIFDAPCNCPEVSGLAITYNGTRTVFTFRDAHKNDLSELPSFTAGARIKVNLDTINSYAYIQNADTNAYLEGEFAKRFLAIESTDYPGCYYRPVEGSDEIEWINPPTKTGEYRTIERFNGKPVYLYRYSQKILNSSTPSCMASFPSTAKDISFDAWYKSGKYYISYLVPGSPVSVSTNPNFISLIWDFENAKFTGGGEVMIILKYTKA